jgi:DNA polymerase-1
MENTTTKKRLFLIDAYALIFRGYYAFIKNPRINSKNMDTSAIMGFMNSLLEVIRREKPDHLAVCFDKGGSVARKEAFEDYKANRQETPEAIRLAVPYIHTILEAMHIPIIEKSGFEADDIIGTLAKQAEKEDFTVFMVTPDKDFAQLVSENIFMWKPARMGNGIEIWGVPEVQAKFEVERPEQVIDYLGMMGDSADNIPGLPGVGDKTAKKFLKQYGSMENLLAHTHELKGKMKEKIEANKDLGLLSKQLATIMLDVPVTFDAAAYTMDKPDMEKVTAILQELEFRRMLDQFARMFNQQQVDKQIRANTTVQKTVPKKKVANNGQLDLFAAFDAAANVSNQEEIPESRFKTLANTDHFYQVIDTEIAQKLLVEKLLQQESVCFDTETTSLNTFEAELVGIAFSYEKAKGYYVPLPANQEETKHILARLKPFFDATTIEKVGHNLKYDIKVLANYNITVKGVIFDTMLAHYILSPDGRHNMDILAETILDYEPVSITSLIGKKGKNQLSMRDVPLKDVVEYAVEDADITFQLKQIFEKDLAELKQTTLFKDVESPLVQVLAVMEREGINLDIDFLKDLSKAITEDILALEKTIYAEANTDFNLASPKQLGTVLFEHLKLVDKPKKTKTGQYATGEDVLVKLADEHQIVKDILVWRGLVKLKNTYIDALPELVNQDTKRLHTTYMQTVAATGRLSSTNPNLQNIPIRTERGRQIRKAFIARDEKHTLLAADYSQIELRIIAALSEEPTMIESFKNGEDIHKATAAKVFNISLDEVTREQRSQAKTVNFGIIYGVSAFGLARQTALSRKEAKTLIEAYYETYPKLKDYIASQIAFAREHGYVQTILGRRRYLNNINSNNAIVRAADERNAVNAPIQGSAADIIKLAMNSIQTKLDASGLNTKMLLQVHDELVFDVPNEELDEIKTLIKTEMESAYQLTVPLLVDLGTGHNWLEAH